MTSSRDREWTRIVKIRVKGGAECGGSRHDNISGFNFPRDLPGNVLQVKGRAAASLVLDCPSRFQRTSVTALEWMLEDLNCVHLDFWLTAISSDIRSSGCKIMVYKVHKDTMSINP